MPNPIDKVNLNRLRLQAKHSARINKAVLGHEYEKLAREQGYASWSNLVKNAQEGKKQTSKVSTPELAGSLLKLANLTRTRLEYLLPLKVSMIQSETTKRQALNINFNSTRLFSKLPTRPMGICTHNFSSTCSCPVGLRAPKLGDKAQLLNHICLNCPNFILTAKVPSSLMNRRDGDWGNP